MKTLESKITGPIKNANLKNLKPIKATELAAVVETANSSEISKTAKVLNAETSLEKGSPLTEKSANISAKSVVAGLSTLPALPIIIPEGNRDAKIFESKEASKTPEKLNFIKKPAVIFIEGFSAFGISNGDGIKDMADNFPGSKRFSWEEQDKIIEEIKRHAPDQPVVLVGHSFGGDSAVEIANTLNSVKNGFRTIDLLVSIDSVGMNNSIIPINVKRNLNFFGEGILPFIHGSPAVARNTDYSEVINELRSELHSKMEDSNEVQFKIFNSINDVLKDSGQPDLFAEMHKADAIKESIGNRLARLKQ